MSLINDALKRARQAQHKHATPPAPGVPLRPVEAARPRASGPGMLLPFAVVAVLVIGLSVLVLWAVNRGEAGKKVAPVTTRESKPSPDIALTPSTPTPIATPPKFEPAPAALVTPAHSLSGAPETATPPPTITAPPAVTPPATTPASQIVAAAPTSAPAWPKLQGIFYRPDRPSALLNGKTVLVGEWSGEFMVVAITRQSVTLVRAGVTNVLRLAE